MGNRKYDEIDMAFTHLADASVVREAGKFAFDIFSRLNNENEGCFDWKYLQNISLVSEILEEFRSRVNPKVEPIENGYQISNENGDIAVIENEVFVPRLGLRNYAPQLTFRNKALEDPEVRNLYGDFRDSGRYDQVVTRTKG